MSRSDQLDFEADGRGWPLRDWSAFHDAAGMRWHVQRGGSGPACLLLHGTGASTHSWRGLAPRLAKDFTVVAPDLPGHGFTDTPGGARLRLETMARRLDALLIQLGIRPALVVGHSAGAAVALRMALDGAIAPAGIVSLNGALQPFRGPAGPLFSAIAKALFLNPLAPRVFAWGADRRRVERLLRNTGSQLDPEGVELYQRLFRNPGHVAGTIAMMANWDLAALLRELPRLGPRLLLVAAEGDRAVPAAGAQAVARRVPRATFVQVPRLGHLAHEEDPERFAEIITEFGREVAVVPQYAEQPVARTGSA